MENLIHLGVSPEEWVFFCAITSLQTTQLFIRAETHPIQRAADELNAL